MSATPQTPQYIVNIFGQVTIMWSYVAQLVRHPLNDVKKTAIGHHSYFKQDALYGTNIPLVRS